MSHALRTQLRSPVPLVDLRRQQLVWDDQYRGKIQSSLQWIYNLQRQQDFDLLTKVFCGDALSPDKMKKVLANLDNRERRNRSYRKKPRIRVKQWIRLSVKGILSLRPEKHKPVKNKVRQISLQSGSLIPELFVPRVTTHYKLLPSVKLCKNPC